MNCGKKVQWNWGLMEPDHLSKWLNPEHCPHHICQYVYGGKQQAEREEHYKATVKACAPSPEVKAVHAWFVARDNEKKKL